MTNTSRILHPPHSAAKYVHSTKAYLDKLRCVGGGPIYIKRGARVFYDQRDLDEWLDAGKRKSTSEAVCA